MTLFVQDVQHNSTINKSGTTWKAHVWLYTTNARRNINAKKKKTQEIAIQWILLF